MPFRLLLLLLLLLFLDDDDDDEDFFLGKSTLSRLLGSFISAIVVWSARGYLGYWLLCCYLAVTIIRVGFGNVAIGLHPINGVERQ